jgi:phosphonate transport system substrate-binding protein
MSITRRHFCAGLLLGALPLRTIAAPRTLTLGLFPNLPVNKLVEIYQPLANYLIQQLGQPVRLSSAKDFRSFYLATRNKEFDLIVTAPNLAWLAMTESHYQPLVRYAKRVSGILVSAKTSRIDNVNACRGKTIAFTDPLTIVYQLGVSYLKTQGLQADADYLPMSYNNHTNAALSVMLGKADCAMIGQLPYAQMSAEVQSSLRIIAHTPEVTSQFILANPDLSTALRDNIRTALIRYAYTTTGAAFIDTQGLGGIINAVPADLATLQTYGLITQAQLSAPTP